LVREQISDNACLIDWHLDEFGLLQNLLELRAKQNAGPYEIHWRTGWSLRAYIGVSDFKDIDTFSSEGFIVKVMTL